MRDFKLLYKDFILFVKSDFKLVPYLLTLLIIVSSILFMYCGHGLKLLGGSVLNHYIMYLLLYIVVLLVNICFRKTFNDLLNPLLYIKVFILMGLLAVSDAFSWKDYLYFENMPALEQSYIFKVLWRSRNVMFVLPVIVIMRVFMDRQVEGLYGLTLKNKHVKAYLILFCMVLPFLIYASFTPDFQSYYPNYKPWKWGEVFSRPVWLNTIIFETVYMFDFVMVELFFRGVLVIGMAKLLGRKAVLPMITIYVALHFGKPVLETISAMFGGYALGALAYQTKHIWGGVIIHMGIALTIELLGFLQYYFI